MIARKGSRSITVRDRQFRWAVRRKPTYAQSLAMTSLNVAAVLATGRGSKLVVRLAEAHPGNVLGRRPASVTPAQVAEWISRALDDGWAPHEPGPPFELVP